MMQEISLMPVKSQEISVTLANQNCRIKIHQRSTGLYMDMYIDNSPVMQGVICMNCCYLVRYKYLRFSGDLVFVDTQGGSDPVWDEVGTRFKLYWLTADEIASQQ